VLAVSDDGLAVAAGVAASEGSGLTLSGDAAGKAAAPFAPDPVCGCVDRVVA